MSNNCRDVPQSLRGLAFVPESGQVPVRYLDSADGVSAFRGFTEAESRASLKVFAPQLLDIALRHPQANRAYLRSHGYRVEDGKALPVATARAIARSRARAPSRRRRRLY